MRACASGAFNAQFERICLSQWLRRNGYPLRNEHYAAPDDPCMAYLNPAGWNCTMVWSAYLGLPLSLKDRGARRWGWTSRSSPRARSSSGISVCRARTEHGACPHPPRRSGRPSGPTTCATWKPRWLFRNGWENTPCPRRCGRSTISTNRSTTGASAWTGRWCAARSTLTSVRGKN